MTRLVAGSLAALALAVVACSDSTASDDDVRADVTYALSQGAGQLLPDTAAVTSANGRVEVNGAFTTGDPCRVIKGEPLVDGDHVQITMRAESSSQGCVAVLGRYDYRATITGLEAGTWTVEVRHLAYGQGGAESVVTKTVTVQ